MPQPLDILMPRRQSVLANIKAFEGLPSSSLAEIERRFKRRRVIRGELLIRQGETADALFIVISGRFRVELAARADAIAEIGPGSPIGEIAFFTGMPRTAGVRAVRDGLVLELDRLEFERLSARIPDLWPAITASLAQRLAFANAALLPRERMPATSIALCAAGSSRIPLGFLRRLEAALNESGRRCAVFDRDRAPADVLSGLAAGTEVSTTWFNALESRCDLVVYVCDAELTPWSEKAIRQADEVVLIGVDYRKARVRQDLNALERFARQTHADAEHRLVLLHAARGQALDSARWLDARPVGAHHHVASKHEGDYRRLCRFLTGTAIGFVAGGGGALCAAHIGVYKALREAGVEIDMMGGTSGGAAMAAAFALGAEPEQTDAALEDIFVRERALKRMTWPRYSLLDHRVFDRCLARHYTDVDIEDLWMPFFALSTNLSSNTPYIHRRGKLWRAVRATGSIPGLLPPCYTDEGEMLVDGGLIDNLPVRTIRDLKFGPNVAVNLAPPRLRRYEVDYDAIPSRFKLFALPWRWLCRNSFPSAPGPASVLMQSLAVHRPDVEKMIRAEDLLLSPPLPPDRGMMDWEAHSQLMRMGYEFASVQLETMQRAGHPLFVARARGLEDGWAGVEGGNPSLA